MIYANMLWRNGSILDKDESKIGQQKKKANLLAVRLVLRHRKTYCTKKTSKATLTRRNIFFLHVNATLCWFVRTLLLCIVKPKTKWTPFLSPFLTWRRCLLVLRMHSLMLGWRQSDAGVKVTFTLSIDDEVVSDLPYLLNTSNALCILLQKDAIHCRKVPHFLKGMSTRGNKGPTNDDSQASKETKEHKRGRWTCKDMEPRMTPANKCPLSKRTACRDSCLNADYSVLEVKQSSVGKTRNYTGLLQYYIQDSETELFNNQINH